LHILSVYLAAIEDEDWKAIGAPVYVRGFMRTYARFLGLDAEDAVARFSSAGPAGSPSPARSDERARVRESSGERKGPSVVGIVALLVALAVVAYVGYAYLTQTRTGTPVAVSSPDVAEPAAAPSPDDVSTPAPRHSAVAHAEAKRGLAIHLSQTSWLRVTVDGTVAMEGTYPAGTAKRFEGNEADLRVGNAGGVELTVNGRPVGSLGASGDVAERHFDLSGE
jgi:cytoskeletal protein RodZ